MTGSPEFSDTWERCYPAIVRVWTDAWAEFVPFLDLHVENRKIVCTTNSWGLAGEERGKRTLARIAAVRRRVLRTVR